MLRTLHSKLRDERGQAAVEFAFMLPILAVVIAIVVQFGLAFVHWNNVSQIAGSAARLAAVNLDPAGAMNGATDILRDGDGQLDGPPAMQITLPDGCDVGDPVHVEVTADWDWLPLVGNIVNAQPVTLRGKATMRLERKADFDGATC